MVHNLTLKFASMDAKEFKRFIDLFNISKFGKIKRYSNIESISSLDDKAVVGIDFDYHSGYHKMCDQMFDIMGAFIENKSAFKKCNEGFNIFQEIKKKMFPQLTLEKADDFLSIFDLTLDDTFGKFKHSPFYLFIMISHIVLCSVILFIATVEELMTPDGG